MRPSRLAVALYATVLLAAVTVLGLVALSLPVVLAGPTPPRDPAGTRSSPPSTTPATSALEGADADLGALAALPPELLVVGDSLTVGAAPTLEQLAAALGLTVRVDAVVGRTTATGLARLARLDPRPGAVVVVALGTNDADDPEYDRAVRTARTLTPHARALVWATVHRREPRTGTNAALRRAAGLDPGLGSPGVPATHPALRPSGATGTPGATGATGATADGPPLRLVDWASTVERLHPEYLTADGVHCTPAGYRARALALLATALEWPVARLAAVLATAAPAPPRKAAYDASGGRWPLESSPAGPGTLRPGPGAGPRPSTATTTTTTRPSGPTSTTTTPVRPTSTTGAPGGAPGVPVPSSTTWTPVTTPPVP